MAKRLRPHGPAGRHGHDSGWRFAAATAGFRCPAPPRRAGRIAPRHDLAFDAAALLTPFLVFRDERIP